MKLIKALNMVDCRDIVSVTDVLGTGITANVGEVKHKLTEKDLETNVIGLGVVDNHLSFYIDQQSQYLKSTYTRECTL